MKKNGLSVVIVAILTALVFVQTHVNTVIGIVAAVPCVVAAMATAIAIKKIADKEEKQAKEAEYKAFLEQGRKEAAIAWAKKTLEMAARMDQLKKLIESNTEEFHAIARYETRGSAWEAVANAERYALFTELWALEDARA